MHMTATYSPDDNKLRLYASTRLGAETYARVKAAGFRWAPKQDLFFTPTWTPRAEDLLIELCGEIGDEDSTLAERAADRADRFEDYSDKRSADAERARKAVAAIADNIPFGQPILVGHHSERHARKDAARIDSGMRRAVNMWETSKYWTARAAGALANAAYKERPDVRARRIKGIEADLRKVQRERDEARTLLAAWNSTVTRAFALSLAGSCHLIVIPDRGGGRGGYHTAYDVLRIDESSEFCPSWTVEQVQEVAREAYPRRIAQCNRWIAHYENRLAYERAMLGASGYIVPPKHATRAVLPLLNYPGEVEYMNRYRGGNATTQAHGMTKAEFAKIHADYRGTFISADGTHRVRSAIVTLPDGSRPLSAIYLTDSKTHTRPGAGAIETREQQETAARIDKALAAIERKAAANIAARGHNRALQAKPEPAKYVAPEPTKFDALKDALEAGIEVVSAPQLFPTPPDLAARMVALAGIEPGMRVLEPSAGTGNLVAAIFDAEPAAHVVAVEQVAALVAGVNRRTPKAATVCGDFLRLDADTPTAAGNIVLDRFDRIVMNPPFANGQDVAHITHALKLLLPGGRLVAICANGPRQNAALRPIVDECGGEWEELPGGTFAGTGVRSVLLTIDRAA